jgi:ABC-type antimicrobial peptide transport system permease subunit
VVALLNVSGYNAGWWFVLPVGLALVGLVFAVQARRWRDVVVSAVVVLAIPLFLLALILLFQSVRLDNNSFSP